MGQVDPGVVPGIARRPTPSPEVLEALGCPPGTVSVTMAEWTAAPPSRRILVRASVEISPGLYGAPGRPRPVSEPGIGPSGWYLVRALAPARSARQPVNYTVEDAYEVLATGVDGEWHDETYAWVSYGPGRLGGAQDGDQGGGQGEGEVSMSLVLDPDVAYPHPQGPRFRTEFEVTVRRPVRDSGAGDGRSPE